MTGFARPAGFGLPVRISDIFGMRVNAWIAMELASVPNAVSDAVLAAMERGGAKLVEALIGFQLMLATSVAKA